MVATVAFAASLIAGQASAGYRLGVFGDHYSVIDPKQHVVDRYPLADPLTVRKKELYFRKNDVSLRWTAAGLSILAHGKQFSTDFAGYPVAPRLRSRDAIRATLDQKLSLKANACSGAVRIGNVVYLVPRWQKAGGAWLEVLVAVNLAEADPRPVALAVVDGASFSGSPVEDNLSVSGETLVLPVHKGLDWGLWRYDTTTGKHEFSAVGKVCKYAKALQDGSIGFVEKTDLDTFVTGILDPVSLVCSAQWESNEPVRFLDLKEPGIAYSSGPEARVHWMDSGLTIASGLGTMVKRGSATMLLLSVASDQLLWRVLSLKTGLTLHNGAEPVTVLKN